MKNLEQIRASNAMKAGPTIKAGPGEGDPQAVAKKVPSLIKENGLLATAAYAKDRKEGIQSVIEAIETHLKHEDIGIMPKTEGSLLSWLSGQHADSALLRRVTAEAMAYLNYLRRFAKKEKNNENARVD